MTSYIGGFAIGTEGLASTVLSDPPTVVITAPTGVVTGSTPTVTFTYTSNLSRPQVFYRYVVEIEDSGIIYDSGPIEGADVSFTLGYPLSAFVSYIIHVGASDGLAGGDDPVGASSGWDSVAVVGEFSEAPTSDNHRVGSVYEVAINGVGYMLQDNPQRPVTRTAALLSSQAPGSDAPFSEEVDRYRFIGHSDFTGGEGQLYLDRPRSDTSRYWHSEWVNPFEPGQASLIPVPELHIADTFVSAAREHPQAVVASGSVFVQTANGSLTAKTTPVAPPSSEFSTGLAGSIVGMTSDGASWYASDGATIRKNTTAGDPGGDWSSVDVTEIAWCTDRIAGLDTAASPPNFTTLAPDGTEENAGGWQGFTGATLRGLCGGDGYIWFGVNFVSTGHIRAWQVGAGVGASVIGLTLPEGESVDSLYFYLGNVFASTSVNEAPFNRKVYRCVPQEGVLTPQLLCTLPGNGTANLHRSWFAGRDRFVAFSWPSLMSDDTSGIGVIDLSTSGYARWQSGGEADRDVTGVVSWAGDFGFVLSVNAGDGGFYGAGVDPDLHDGHLDTSVSDLGSNQAKVVDSISLTTLPLAGTIDASYSLDSDATFVPAGSMTGQGTTTIELPVTAAGPSIGFRVELNANGDVGPVLKRIAAKIHLRNLADQVITLPINCGDVIAGLNGVTIEPDSRPGAGIERIQTLESLLGQTVAVQNVDWPRSRQSQNYQLISAESTLTGAFDPNKNYRVDHGVCIVTLRRSIS